MEIISSFFSSSLFTQFSAILLLLFLYAYVDVTLRKRSDTLKETYPFQNSFLLAWNNYRLLHFLHDIVDKILPAKTVSLNLVFSPTMILTNDINNITYVLKNVDIYGKGSQFSDRFGGVLGDGIFNSDGEVWYKHRKTSSNLFSLNRFKSKILDTFNAHCETLNKVIQSKGDASFDIQILMQKFTLDSIGKIAFGYEIGALTRDRVLFAEAFDFCQYHVNECFINPFWRIIRYCTPEGWKYFSCLKTINEFAYKVVKQRREEFAAHPDDETINSDLISCYLSRQDVETEGELSDEYLRNVVLNFVIAGRDTTANALSWSFYRLCIHPDIQQRVYDEVIQVIGQERATSTNALNLSYDEISQMKYLEAFCYEVLRLYPSVPKEAKFAFKDDKLPDGTEVKKGNMICFSSWIMGRTEENWQNCLEFSPDRFYDKPKPSPFLLTAFQAGPRICLGQNMALLEMKAVIAQCVRLFRFELAQKADEVTYLSTIVLPIKDNLMVKASSRVSK